MGDKPYTMQVIDAVGTSALPPELRLLLFAMAHLATSDTGVGLSGQGTIAKFIGCSDRQVRNNLLRLESFPDSPVQVVRRYRSRADGRGRTSDEYRLVLTNRKPTSDCSAPPTGSPLPIGHSRAATTNRKPSVDQPEVQRTTNRKPTSEDQRRDQLSDQRREEKAATSAAPWRLQPVDGRKQESRAHPSTPRKAKRKAKPDRTDAQRETHQRVTAHYHAEFERQRRTKPVGWGEKEGKAVYDLLEKCQGDEVRACELITNGLRSWDKATIMYIAANPSACVAGTSTGGGQGVRAGDLLGRQMQRVAALEAGERAGKALP